MGKQGKAGTGETELLRQIIACIPCGLVMSDAEGRIVLVNPQIEKAFGYGPDELVGQSIEVLVPPRLRGRHTAYRAGYMTHLEGRPMGAGRDLVGLRRDGTEFPVEIGLTPIRTQQGPMVLGTVVDITLRKQAEAQLVEARERAEEMTRLKSAFLANMSHEIRTPLTAIIGFAGILAEEVPAEKRAFAQIIHDGARRLMTTLNSVLDLAQLEGRTVEVQYEPVDVRQVVAETLALFEPQARGQGLSLRLVAPPGRRVRVLLDRVALERILANLVSNAIKFTHQGGVTVTVGRSAEAVTIEVADTGVGIGDAFRTELFKEFKQESTGLSRRYEGSGLGLAITKRLVQLLDGDITAESRPGEGSTFCVRLPRRPAWPRRGEPWQELRLPAGGGSVRTGRVGRVLVVEDHAETRALFEHLLTGYCDADVAAGPGEALQLSALHPYDVVIVDAHLGAGIDGVELLHVLRANPQYRNVPILVCTAYAMPGDRGRFLEAGFDGYVAKPFMRHELLEAIRRAATGDARPKRTRQRRR